jgi:hypothetical protein
LGFHPPFAVAVILAAGLFWIYGSAILRRLVREDTPTLPILAIYAGQMALWLAAYLILPLNALLFATLGFELSISTLLWSGALILAGLRIRRQLSDSTPTGDLDSRASGVNPTSVISAIGAGAAVLWVAQLYGDHLGALGLDTHQHIYWTNQILDAGHLPLVERGTSILALYPRAFHVLVALWSAPGPWDFVGPWVKLMPFFQTLLTCRVFAELCATRIERRDGVGRRDGVERPDGNESGDVDEKRDSDKDCDPVSSRERIAQGRFAAFVLVTTLLVYGFAIGPMVFPEYDLNGTPRLASSAALFFPYLALVAGLLLERTLLIQMAWFSLPTIALLLLALNAVLVVQLLIFTIPLMVLTRYFVGRDSPRATRVPFDSPATAALITLIPALAIALGDPWIVALWSEASGFAGTAFLELFGVVTPNQAADLGIISRDELVANAIETPRVAGVRGIIGLFASSLLEAVNVFVLGLGWRFPFLSDPYGDAERIVLRGLMTGSVLAAVVLARHRMPANAKGYDAVPGQVWVAITGAAMIGGFVQIAAWKFAEGLATGRGYAFVLLRDYLEVAPRQVGLAAQCLWLLAGFAWLIPKIPIRGVFLELLPRAGVTLGLGLAVASIPLLVGDRLGGFDPDRSFWSLIDHTDLADLREIETQISEWEGVLVPTSAWEIGDEKWIIPQGATASVLPFATRRYYFNSRLGPGVKFNWRDLAHFCSSGSGHRAQFLESNDIRWLLVSDPNSASQSFYRGFRICDLQLAELGAVHPPAHRAGELSLYRLEPSALLEDR